jgi:hypothetical protein
MAAKDDAPRKVGRDGFGDDANNSEYTTRLRVMNLRDNFPEIIDIAARVAPMVAKLMDFSSVRLWSDMLFIKKGDSQSKPTMWHQDLPKVPVDRRGMVNAWNALDDVPVKRGAIPWTAHLDERAPCHSGAPEKRTSYPPGTTVPELAESLSHIY